jgi:type IV pilus assembly protein PilC
MAEFNYVAITPSGQRITGSRTSDSKDGVVTFLTTQGLTIISISERFRLNFDKFASTDIGGLPLKEKVILMKQLYTMISAGIPILQAMDILIQQSEKASLKLKLQRIYKAIEAGSSLTTAFKAESGLLNEVQINLLEAGEKSGKLNEILKQISEDMEKSKDLRGKITGALIYPVIILVVMVIVMIIMIVFMAPQVKDLYASLGQTDLPATTQVLVSIGESFSNGVAPIVIIFSFIALFFSIKYAQSTEGGTLFLDKFKLKLPVFGELTKKEEIASFARTMSMLLKSGIPIIESIEITGKSLGNAHFKRVLNLAKEDVIKGSNLSVGMAKYNEKWIYPIILIRIIAVGEEAGKLEKILDDMTKFYENELEQMTGNLTKLIEPIMMVFIGFMVGFLALAVYTPTLQLVQNIK